MDAKDSPNTISLKQITTNNNVPDIKMLPRHSCLRCNKSFPNKGGNTLTTYSTEEFFYYHQFLEDNANIFPHLCRCGCDEFFRHHELYCYEDHRIVSEDAKNIRSQIRDEEAKSR